MTKGSGDARMQPLYFLITTAGTDTHSICYEAHQKAKDILKGRKIDPTFYPVISKIKRNACIPQAKAVYYIVKGCGLDGKDIKCIRACGA